MGGASIPYNARDYDAIRAELVARIPSLTDRWTDFNPTDPGIVLLELFCGVAEMLFQYIDEQTAEAFLPTARQRQNVLNLCKLIAYRLRGPVCATVDLRFSLPVALDGDFTIPAGTVCRARLDDGDVWFETAEDLVILSGQTEGTVSARQGRRKTEEFVMPATVRLTAKKVASESIRVIVDGVPWEEVTSFHESRRDSLHFLAETDGNDVTTVTFGDGVSGSKPATGDRVVVDYLETLASEGNIGARLITDLVTPLYHDGQLVTVHVTNPRPATGGAEAETIDFARYQAPAELRTSWRAVTKEDYKTLVEGYPGVAKAQILDTNDCLNIRYYTVNIAVAPNGGGLPSALLKKDLADYLESRRVITTQVNLYDPSYREVAIDAELFAYTGEDLDAVRARAETALADFFAFDRMDFGTPVRISDVVALLDGVRGVSYVQLFLPASDLITRPGEIPVLGPLQLTVKRAQG